jgi:hypothetical protein
LAEQRRPASSSIFLLDVPLHRPSHLDQTTPNLLKERNHLFDLGAKPGEPELKLPSDAGPIWSSG